MKNVAALYGFVVGSWPDTGDWLAAQVGLYPRWTLYNLYHHHAPWYWLIQPPFFMHVKVTDPPFHILPGWDWWPTMWSVAVLWWLFRLLAFVVCLRRDEVGSGEGRNSVMIKRAVVGELVQSRFPSFPRSAWERTVCDAPRRGATRRACEFWNLQTLASTIIVCEAMEANNGTK